MVAYNFQKQFADDVESGKKKQTVRPVGKRRHAKVGDALQLYYGQRTKQCRKLRDAVCVRMDKIAIQTFGVRLDSDSGALQASDMAGEGLVWLENFAKRDGFESWEAMRDWFEQQHSLPFEGVLIMWE